MRMVWIRLRGLFGTQRRETDLADEIRAHIDQLADDHVRHGLSPDEARAAARRDFGGVDQMKEAYRDQRGFMMVDNLVQDVRFAVRMLRRNPAFSLTAVLSLAIGIGAGTAVFTVVNAILLHEPAGVIEPERLVDIGSSRSGNGFGPSSYPNYLDLRDRATTLEGVYAQNLFPRAMSFRSGASTAAERVFAVFVTNNYFNVLGARPSAGRLFDVRDPDEPGAASVVVLSHRFWSRRFGGDPDIIGRTLLLDGRPFAVAGIAAEGFQGTGIRASDLWVPMSMMAATASQVADVRANRGAAWLLVGGRMKSGVTRAQAALDVDGIGRMLVREHPDENRGLGLRAMALSAIPGNGAFVGAFLALLLAVVSLVLIITCANLAGVLLARAAARRREIAVRLAMGAGRGRLVRQLLAETLVLFAAGGVAGLVVARVTTSLAIAYLPQLPFPIDVSLALDWRVLLFTVMVVLIAAIACGLLPALQASKGREASAMRDEIRTPERRRLRQVFITAQVAFSILLVVVAGLFVRALERAGSLEPGFDPADVELVSLNLSQAGYTDVTGPRFVRALLDRVHALPDVRTSSAALVPPGGFETRRQAVSVPGRTPPDGMPFFGVDWNAVEPGYFETLRIPLVAGRDFTAADRAGAELVAIVGEGTARQFWPGQSAVGRQILNPVFGARGPTGVVQTLRVVGVARDIKVSSLVDGLGRSFLYVPLQQQYSPEITIVARGAPRRSVGDELRRLAASMDPGLPVTTQTLEQSLALGQVLQRIAASMTGSLGVVGLLLASIGIYGVTAYTVAQRTREIGIRIALGARPRDMVLMVLRQGMTLAAAGSVAGLVLAAGAGQLLTAFLFGLPPLDPLVFGGAAALFTISGLIACYVPSRRASRVEPMVALRAE